MKKSVKKVLILTLCAVLLVGGSVLGTMAALNATSDKVINTFVAGKIFTDDTGFDLYEHNLTWTGDSPSLGTTEVLSNDNYKVIPGVDLPKDPTVYIDGNTVDIFVFFKVEETTNWDDNVLSYEIDSAWKALGTGYDGIYYQALDTGVTDTELPIIAGDMIYVDDDLGITDINAVDDAALSFTAYVCQQAGYTGTGITEAQAAVAAWDANF